MTDIDDARDDDVLDLLAGRLVKEAGITKDQARELIKLIGTDWSSLLREAHFIKESGTDK
ncbi:hypothetical protein [Mesorhizobium sp. B1-1-8]|uniref:hypothetical protein n=1 Tax=Mesorhizobium sp. B1-1-8 TaxID=2589976 RepID=UPI00112A6283|nr:hypothetical protein [Mesorhizobium sp. B1-1-8]UCI10482.1 hypothetical protein FJ974_29690 [Mesorhizobium sp. B1-1-8]